MKIRFLAKPILLLLLIATLSCEKETLLPEKQTADRLIQPTPVAMLRTGFSLDNFNDPAKTIKDNIEIQWENYTAKTISETLWYEFGVTQQQKTDMVSEFQEDNQYTLLARLDEYNRPHYFIAKLAPQKWITSKAFSYLDPQGFSGTVSLYNMQGEVAFLEYYKKGQVQNSVQDISIKEGLITPVSNKCMQRGTAMAKCETALECAFAFADGASTGGGCGSGGNAGGSYVAVRTDHYTDWYNIRGDGTADYSHTQFNGSSYDYVYVSGLYSGGYQHSYSYYNYTGLGEYGTGEEGYYTDTPPVNEQPERIIIDKSFFVIPKINCTYNQLIKNTTIKSLLEDFFGDDAEFDLTFKVVENLTCKKKTNAEGCTSSHLNKQGKVEISISKEYINNINTPTLFLAQVLIHEAIHANLYLAVFNHENGNPANIPDINDFGAVYEKYREVKKWQHEFMADHYIDLMAQALKDVHQLLDDQNFIDILGSDYPDLTLDEFYTNIAWLGLNGTNAQADYLSNQDNSNNYNISYYTAKSNATKAPKCD